MHVYPGRLTLLIALLFMVGSSCFALGSLPAYADGVATAVDLTTFFVGSIFFTSASFLQLVQAQSPAMAPGGDPDGGRARLRFRGWLPHDRNWLAAATQFPGTLAFNVSTFGALAIGLTYAEQDRQIRRPDFVGSILFLVASTYALLALDAGRRWWAPRDWGWWVGWLNMLGSILFMLSAIGSFVLPTTGDFVNSVWSDAGTFGGAVCFFLGAGALIPLWRRAVREHGL